MKIKKLINKIEPCKCVWGFESDRKRGDEREDIL